MQPFVATPPVAPDDPVYLQAARDEAAFWADPLTLHISDAMVAAPTGPIKRYYNRRHSRHPTTTWFDAVAGHGPFRRGLILGCGGLAEEQRILETNPALHVTICDIDRSGLARRETVFGGLFPGRVEVREADLNFVRLERDAYDLIVSGETLHHIVNLEHVAGEVAAALAPGGQFFLHDYTGPSGFRFPEPQRRVFEAIYARERRRRPNAPLPPVTWRDVDSGAYSPFEAVRSAETLAALGAELDLVWSRGAGPIIGLLKFAGLADAYRRRPSRSYRLRRRVYRALGRPQPMEPLVWEEMLSPVCTRELATVDAVVCDSGLFPPSNTFALYRKRPG
jgi:SAM-dependent methyltransferase